jgi:hypothetical protein
MSTEIKKVVIRMGKKDVDLTLEEARELKDALAAFFPSSIPISYPIIIERDPYWARRWWQPYYTSGTTSGMYMSGSAGQRTAESDTLYLCKAGE